MIQRIRRALTRNEQKAGGVREPSLDWRVTLRRRTTVAAVMLGLWAAGIEVRLVKLQVFDRADLAARAARQQQRTIAAPARRGDIVDRRGHVLATSADSDSIFAIPSEIENESAVVAALCKAFTDCTSRERQTLLDRLGKQRAFAYVRRQVSPDVARRVAALNLPGIDFLKESQRFYPNRELAAHLLGWVGVDNTGLGGIEAAYDSQIHGKDGKVLVHADARRQAFDRLERSPVPGSSIELTIDEYLQHVAERELHAGVLENRAEGGSVVIISPQTGEILAMANEPTFNPNAYRDSREAERRNRAVQDLYEPGSTFKVVTASAALEERLMTPETAIDARGGQIQIGKRVVHDTHDYGMLSFTDVLSHSSNVGAIKIGFTVGTTRLSEFVRRFGFGRAVSPDFPGENWGIVWDQSKWTESALASVSMGYQIGVTPLQMVAAVSSVANGGQYVQPRVVRAVYRGDRRFAIAPKIVGRTISANTAAALTTIMEEVVNNGTAKGIRRNSRLCGRRQDRHGEQAHQRTLFERHLCVICRLPALPQTCRRDPRGSRLAARRARALRRACVGADFHPYRRGHTDLPWHSTDGQSRAAGAGRPAGGRVAASSRNDPEQYRPIG